MSMKAKPDLYKPHKELGVKHVLSVNFSHPAYCIFCYLAHFDIRDFNLKFSLAVIGVLHHDNALLIRLESLK
jgi:hypothetical protein